LLDTPWPKAEQRRHQLQDRQIRRHLHQLDETGGAQRRDVIRVEDSAVPDGEDHEPAQTILKAPLPNARPRARKEVLVPGNAGSPQRVDQALILTLARARSWMRALQQGEYTHTAEIAGRFGLARPRRGASVVAEDVDLSFISG
jgi:hypothetical protein